MKTFTKVMFAFAVLAWNVVFSQETPREAKKDEIIEAIIKEATGNSQLEILGHELMDGIGPRLVGSPKMKQAHDWAVSKYTSWGIAARNEKWGEWRGWERGTTHID